MNKFQVCVQWVALFLPHNCLFSLLSVGSHLKRKHPLVFEIYGLTLQCGIHIKQVMIKRKKYFARKAWIQERLVKTFCGLKKAFSMRSAKMTIIRENFFVTNVTCPGESCSKMTFGKWKRRSIYRRFVQIEEVLMFESGLIKQISAEFEEQQNYIPF